MKHLKKYNEDLVYFGDEDEPRNIFNIEDHIDIEYINGCFSNLIDNADIDYEVDDEDIDIKQSYELAFYTDDIVKYANGDSGRIQEAIRHTTEVSELLQEIDSCVRKVQIQYPNLIPNLDIEYEGIMNSRGNSLVAFSDLHPITCIAVRYTEESVQKYLKK